MQSQSKFRAHSTWTTSEQARQASIKAGQVRSAHAKARKALALATEMDLQPTTAPTFTDPGTDPVSALDAHLSRLIRLNASPATIDRLCLALSRLKRIPLQTKDKAGTGPGAGTSTEPVDDPDPGTESVPGTVPVPVPVPGTVPAPASGTGTVPL